MKGNTQVLFTFSTRYWTTPGVTMKKTGKQHRNQGDLIWEVRRPPIQDPSFRGTAPEWLIRIQEMRGRILLQDGTPTGNPPSIRLDEDPLDFHSYHLTATQAGLVIGCTRLTPHLSREMLREFIDSLRLSEEFRFPLEFLERPTLGSRWVVEPDHRSMSLAFRLIAGCYALASRLDLSSMHGITGTKSGQDRLLIRTGAAPVEEAGMVYSIRHQDSVRLLHIDLPKIPATFSSLVYLMDGLMKNGNSGEESTCKTAKQSIVEVAS
jgi:hypothetical protein